MSCDCVKKVKNIAYGFSQLPFALTEEATKRLEICKICEFGTKRKRPINFCRKCGCLIIAKVRVPDEKCPERKW